MQFLEKTAAEMINERVNAEKPFLGLTNFKGDYITVRDVGIAKNYLLKEELKIKSYCVYVS